MTLEERDNEVGFTYDRLGRAWVFASKVPDTDFGNAIIDALVATAKEYKTFPNDHVIYDMYQSMENTATHVGGRLCMLILMFCRFRNNEQRRKIADRLRGRGRIEADIAFTKLQPGNEPLLRRVFATDFYDP